MCDNIQFRNDPCNLSSSNDFTINENMNMIIFLCNENIGFEIIHSVPFLAIQLKNKVQPNFTLYTKFKLFQLKTIVVAHFHSVFNDKKLPHIIAFLNGKKYMSYLNFDFLPSFISTGYSKLLCLLIE